MSLPGFMVHRARLSVLCHGPVENGNSQKAPHTKFVSKPFCFEAKQGVIEPGIIRVGRPGYFTCILWKEDWKTAPGVIS